MALISKTIPNLIEGVSEQPPAARLRTQAEAQENFVSSVVNGLVRRGPTKHLAKVLASTTLSSPLVHWIDRDSDERYCVIINKGDLRVFDLDGVEKTVNVSDRTSTLESARDSTGLLTGTSRRTYKINTETQIDVTTTGVAGGLTLQIQTAPDDDGAPGSWTTRGTMTTNTTTSFTMEDWIRFNITVVGTGTHTITGTWKSTEYIGTDTPDEDVRAVTIADYTFFTNNTVTAALSSAVTIGDDSQGALLFVKQGTVGGDYRVKLYDTVVVQKRVATSDAANQDPSTRRIASDIADFLNANLNTAWAQNTAYVKQDLKNGGSIGQGTTAGNEGFNQAGSVRYANGNYYVCRTSGTSAAAGSGPSGTGTGIADNTCTWDYVGARTDSWTITTEDFVVKILLGTGTALDTLIKVEDSQAGTLFRFINGETQRFSDLPVIAPHNYVAKIKGGSEDNFDNFYVKFTAEDESFSAGAWDECAAPSVQYTFDATTLPHTLVREADGTFTYAKATWAERGAGDADSAPAPSFIGGTIRDIFFYENRLGVISDENVVLTELSEFFNFWPTTVMTQLDTDRIDVAASDNKVALLKFGVPWDQKLVLFSDKTQFVLSADGGLSPRTARIRPTTGYELLNTVRPVGAGRMVYFAGSKGDGAAVREYLVSPDEVETKEAPDIAAHVPAYIPNTVVELVPAPNDNMIVVRAAPDGHADHSHDTALFVYNYFWRGQDKVQSAWHKWTFSGAISGARFFDQELYLVFQFDDGVHLEKLSIATNDVDDGLEYLTHLDRRIEETDVTPVYDAGTNRTTLALPYDVGSGGTWRCVARDDDPDQPAGYLFTVVSCTGTSMVVSGDRTLSKFYIGREYESRYRFSKQYVKEDKEGGETAIVDGNLILTSYVITFADTGYFDFKTIPDVGDESTQPFTGRILGESTNVLGTAALHTGAARFVFGQRSDKAMAEISTTSFLPASFQSAVWQGRFHLRGRRVGGA